ncbi:MAG: hypothetical protein CMH32_06905 [Micavibrio sp.]|nr:hypothetical protein [Micavibrio sp.]
MSKNILYPPQTGNYAVKVKKHDGWQDYNTARFQISVGMSYHEEDKFLAQMMWAQFRFKKVIIAVNDTLQRFNFMASMNITEEKASKMCAYAGEQWIERNQAALSKIPNIEIVRWEEWKKDVNYKIVLNAVSDMYLSDANFAAAVNTSIENYLNNKDRNHNNFELCKHYMFEEVAIFTLMYNKETAIDVYPGTLMMPADFLKGSSKYPIFNSYKKQGFCRIDFKRQFEDRADGLAIAS